MSTADRQVLLVVKDAHVATFLSQNMRSVDVIAFGQSVIGMSYDVVVVCDPADSDSATRTAQVRNWLDTAVRTRVTHDGIYVESYRREAPPEPADPPR